jgi:hypothetical protein
MKTLTKDEYRAKFRRARSVAGRFNIFLDAACSGQWKKCKGSFRRGEKVCIMGLAMDLGGRPGLSDGGFRKLIGINPQRIIPGRGVTMFNLNDNTNLPLCELAKVAKKVYAS